VISSFKFSGRDFERISHVSHVCYMSYPSNTPSLIALKIWRQVDFYEAPHCLTVDILLCRLP